MSYDDHKREGEEAAKKLADDLGNFVNRFGSFDKEFIAAWKREHRTLQQSSMRLILKLIEDVAEDDYTFDARNEASHKVAKDLLKGFKLVKEAEYGTSMDHVKVKASEHLGCI